MLKYYCSTVGLLFSHLHTLYEEIWEIFTCTLLRKYPWNFYIWSPQCEKTTVFKEWQCNTRRLGRLKGQCSASGGGAFISVLAFANKPPWLQSAELIVPHHWLSGNDKGMCGVSQGPVVLSSVYCVCMCVRFCMCVPMHGFWKAYSVSSCVCFGVWVEKNEIRLLPDNPPKAVLFRPKSLDITLAISDFNWLSHITHAPA